jgi:predicted regulator of Ras-like GTPase activity (Roadblock/LC7/MglB family)
MTKLQELLIEMSSEIPGFIAASVTGMDGLGIATHSLAPDLDVTLLNAQFPFIMKLDSKSSALFNDKMEEGLTTTDDSYLIYRFLGDGSFYLGLAADKKTASLGNLKLIVKQFADRLWQLIPRKR